MSYAKLDAAADAMKSKMQSERRNLESQHGQMLCSGWINDDQCDNVAAEGSCYCDDGERSIG